MGPQGVPVLSNPPAPRLTGRLPFEAESDSSKHHLLIASIKQVTRRSSAGSFTKSVQGFSSRLISELDGLSLEVKLLLARLLTVEPHLRINVSAALYAQHFTSLNSEHCCRLNSKLYTEH